MLQRKVVSLQLRRMEALRKSEPNVYDRLVEAMKARGKVAKRSTSKSGVDIVELREVLGISDQHARKFLDRKHPPDSQTGIKLAKWLEISYVWLMTGEGDMDARDDNKLDDEGFNIVGDLIDEAFDLRGMEWTPRHVRLAFRKYYNQWVETGELPDVEVVATFLEGLQAGGQ